MACVKQLLDLAADLTHRVIEVRGGCLITGKVKILPTDRGTWSLDVGEVKFYPADLIGEAGYHPANVAALLRHFPPPLDPAELLAFRVLTGDRTAAGPLADRVAELAGR